MIEVNCDYNITSDIGFIMEAEHINNIEFARRTKISRTTLDEIMKRGSARSDVYEKIYSYAYERKYRMNSVKEELVKENTKVFYFMVQMMDYLVLQKQDQEIIVILVMAFILVRHIRRHYHLCVRRMIHLFTHLYIR